MGPSHLQRLRSSQASRFSLLYLEHRSLCLQPFTTKISSKPLKVPRVCSKIVMGALAIVLEAIYEPKFLNMSHGCRPKRGRHTAIKDMKHVFHDPSWWVCLNPQKEFDEKNNQKLLSAMASSIDDALFLNLLDRLLLSSILQLEVGGYPKGLGFPQDYWLSSLLLNIYLDELDQKVLHIRKLVQMEAFSTLLHSHGFEKLIEMMDNEDEYETDGTRTTFDPIKVYSCRYVDEMIVAVKGTKTLALLVTEFLVSYIKSHMHLEINMLETQLRNTVEERVKFLGMEIQAVPLSEMQAQKSDKAIRAFKKLWHRKKVFALQQRNPSETRLKEVGLKLLDHVCKKSRLLTLEAAAPPSMEKDSQGLLLLKAWAREVVEEFMDSEDEKSAWREKLARGYVLTKPSFRQHLPESLLDAHDELQKNIDKYLVPIPIPTREEKEEEGVASIVRSSRTNRVAKHHLGLVIYAPIRDLLEKLRFCGIIHRKGKPQAVASLCSEEDLHIVHWYACIARQFLDYFQCCTNFLRVKVIVNYHLRQSCIRTLAKKHCIGKREVVKKYTKDLQIPSTDHCYYSWSFPTESEIKNMGSLFHIDPRPVDGFLNTVLKASKCTPVVEEGKCILPCCQRYAIRYIVHVLKPEVSSKMFNQMRTRWDIYAHFAALHGRELLLCPKHHCDLILGKTTFQDVNHGFCEGDAKWFNQKNILNS